MLKPAQLYEQQLQEENLKAWYKPENIFWNGGTATIRTVRRYAKTADLNMDGVDISGRIWR